MNSEHKNRELRKVKNVKRDRCGNLVSSVSKHGELIINVKVKSESEKCENGFEWKSC